MAACSLSSFESFCKLVVKVGSGYFRPIQTKMHFSLPIEVSIEAFFFHYGTEYI